MYCSEQRDGGSLYMAWGRGSQVRYWWVIRRKGLGSQERGKAEGQKEVYYR